MYIIANNVTMGILVLHVKNYAQSVFQSIQKVSFDECAEKDAYY